MYVSVYESSIIWSYIYYWISTRYHIYSYFGNAYHNERQTNGTSLTAEKRQLWEEKNNITQQKHQTLWLTLKLIKWSEIKSNSLTTCHNLEWYIYLVYTYNDKVA